ncbi:MAG TPA: ABC transporter permease [Acidimicrobiales bacterium]|nr:ABC transporter permease [Acidimicrobiales bacterium]
MTNATGLRAISFGAVGPYVPAVVILVVALVVYPVPIGVTALGLVLGMLGALVALGLALIQRANRILNFAQADLGTLPSTFAYGCIVSSWGLPYLLSFFIGLVGAVVIGALVEFLLIRRFFKASRLVLTVATIGMSQLFIVCALLLPRIWGEQALNTSDISFPGGFQITIGTQLFGADSIAAVAISALALVALAVFLGRSNIGIAVRASAERADRAASLGIPVKRINTLVWAIAAVLSYLGVFLRASILGIPLSATVSITTLIAALSALVLAGAACLPAVALTAVALGILEQGVGWHAGDSPTLVYVVYAVVVFVGLILKRAGQRRVDADDTASWHIADDPRPLPAALRRLPVVIVVRWSAIGLGLAVLVWLGAWLGPADQQKAATVACFALITLSIVVLTGWAGQVSLGQMSFAAVGAVAGAVAVATWHWDLLAALGFAGVCGAAAATLVGLPSLRLRGFYLAVATLALALATSGYLLNRSVFSWIPNGRIDRPSLLGTFELSSEGTMYAVCVVVALLGLVAAHGIRNSHTGRVLRAVRGNESAAQAYGVRLLWAKLTAFAVSGFLAGVAGCLLTMISQQYTEGPFTATESIGVFTAAVVGGVGSLTGAVIGAIFAKGGTWFLPANWQLLPSAIGVLGVLLALPGGLADVVFRLRDTGGAWLADRRGIAVPSLRGQRNDTDEPDLVDLDDLARTAANADDPATTDDDDDATESKERTA